MATQLEAEDVLAFWFDEVDEALWWRRDDALDATIGERFGALHKAAAACELAPWRVNAAGRLAEIIVLDQFSRNLYRDSPRAFAQDPLALALAQEAVAAGCDAQLEERQRPFLYMPYMHSESARVHLWAVELFGQLPGGGNLEFELKHKAVIDRFGRYPSRNEALGRVSTAEEREFLARAGSGW